MNAKNTDVLSTLVVIVYIHIGVIVSKEDPQSALFVNCSFKNGMCHWESISAGWEIGQGSSTTSGTGSAHDHALGNASRISVNASQSQVLQSPLPWNCYSLHSHICGKGSSNLTVSIETMHTTTATKFNTTQSGIMTILWSKEGKLDDKWHSVEITLQTRESAKVLLVGTTKRQNGAIAVDDIQLSKCSCKGNCKEFWNWIKNTSDNCTRTFGVLFPSPQSGCTNKTTGPQSDGTNKNTKAQNGTRATSTTRDLKESTFSVGWEYTYTNTTRPAQSNVTEASTNDSGRQIKTQEYIPKVTGTNATSTTRDLKESTLIWDEALTNTTRPAETNFKESYTTSSGRQITTQGHIPEATGTNTTSTTRDLKESTFILDEALTNATRPAETNFKESYTIASGRLITTKGHIPEATVCIIIGSLAGTMTLVAVVLFAAVCIYRTKSYLK